MSAALDGAINVAVQLRSENDALRARLAAQDALLRQAEAALAHGMGDSVYYCTCWDGNDSDCRACAWQEESRELRTAVLVAIRAARKGGGDGEA